MAGLTQSDVRDALEKAERELQELQIRAAQLREWISATKKLCSRRRNASSANLSFPLLSRPKRRREGTIADYAAEVLRSVGRPIHVSDLVVELEKRGHKTTTSTLAVALARRPDQFAKIGPNQFELITQNEAKVS